MAAIFPPAHNGGVPPDAPNVCNGFNPAHAVIGEGPLYYSSECTTLLTDCAINSLTSEILAAVDRLDFPYNANRITNLGDALVARFEAQQADINNRVARSGDTMTGPLELVCPPDNDNDAACKKYTDDTAQSAADACCTHMQGQLDAAVGDLQAAINTRVRRDGDQMTGPLILSSDLITLDEQAATKAYVDLNSGGIIIATDVPAGVPERRLWWQSSTGKLYIHYNDGDSLQWVGITPEGGAGPGGGGELNIPPVIISPTLPVVTTGYLWWDSVIGRLFLGFNNQWIALTEPDGGGAGGGIPDAPPDGQLYGRQNNSWQPITVLLDGGSY